MAMNFRFNTSNPFSLPFVVAGVGILIAIIIGLAAIFLFRTFAPERADLETETSRGQQSYMMKLISSVFSHAGAIPSAYTCDGANVNPPLQISGVPENAKGLALIFDDPDAPAGTWVHWIMWNMSPDTAEILENSLPQGAAEGITSFGKSGYGGPCPPSGTHRYFFKLYALDTILALDSSATKEDLLAAMEGHILSEAQLMGTYQRK